MRAMIMRVLAACVLVATACGVVYGLRAHRSFGAAATPAAAASALTSVAQTVPVGPARPSASPVREITSTPAPTAAAPIVVSTPVQVVASKPAPMEPATPVQVAASTSPATAPAAAPPAPAAAPTSATTTPGPAAPPAAVAPCPGNPNALGVSRIVEIDTTGGPGFGFEHFKQYDFLKPGEVVLTFDDGPWPRNTPMVLDALAAQCTKALFFPIGKHSMWHPEILKQVAEQGHTIGSHTWSHADLTKKKPEEAKQEIEMGLSAVHMALGAPVSPFFRFPDLRHPPEMLAYLGQRNIAVFSCDMDSFDFKLRRPEQVIQSVMSKLKTHGKGIILMHDFQRATAEALPELLRQIKAGGYRVVQIKAKQPAQTLPEFDAIILKEFGGSSVSTRPVSSVVKTIGGE